MMPPKTILILLGLGLLAISTVGILSFSFIETKQETKSLKKQLEYLEGNIESTKQKNLEKLEELQVELDHQTNFNRELKLELETSEAQKEIINTKSNENKASIHRIHAVDSLYRTIARHYR